MRNFKANFLSKSHWTSFFVLRSSFFVLILSVFFSDSVNGQAVCCGPLTFGDNNCEGALFSAAYLYNPQSGNATLSGRTLLNLPGSTHCWTLFLELNGELVPMPNTSQNTVDYTLNQMLDRGCYVLRHCATPQNAGANWCDWRFCVDYTAPGDECDNICCVLTLYGLFHRPNGVWQWGDGTTNQTHPGPWHTYHNVNTYQVNPIVIRSGTRTFPIQVIEGIFVGDNCSTTSIATQVNLLDQNQLLFPGGTASLGQSASERIAVDGTLELDKAFTFSSNDFCMKPGSRLLTRQRRLITIQGSELHDQQCRPDDPCNNSCGAWFGIEQFAAFGRGTSLSITNSRITGAYNGVYSNGTGGTNELRLNTVTFDRDYLGLRIGNWISIPTFHQNTFGAPTEIAACPAFTTICPWVTQIPKQHLHTPFAGIYITGPFTMLDLSNASGTNTFQNLANGIYSEDASLTVRNCQMLNMVCDHYPKLNFNTFDDGYGIYLNSRRGRTLDQIGFGKSSLNKSFRACRTGIFVSAQSGPDATVRVRDNHMDFMHNGVLLNFGANTALNATQSHFVSNNRISYGRETCQGDNSAYGIYAYLPRLTTATLDINDNTVVADGAPPPFQHFGIRIAGATVDGTPGSVRARLQRNNVVLGQRSISSISFQNAYIADNECSDFTDFGVHTQASPLNVIANNTTTSDPQPTSSSPEQNSGIKLVSSRYNRVSCNTTNNTSFGLHLQTTCTDAVVTCNSFRNHDAVGVRYSANPIAGLQRPGMTDPRNNWVGDYSAPRLHAEHVGLNNLPSNTFFSGKNVYNVSPSSGWFENPSGPSFVCECNGLDEFGQPTDLSDLERRMLDGQLPTTPLELFDAKKDLYSRLKQQPGLLDQHALTLSFLQTTAQETVGKLADLEYQISLLPELHQLPAYMQKVQRLQDIEARLLILNSELQAGTLLDDQEAERTSLSAELEQLHNETDQIVTGFYQNQSAAVVTLLQSLQTVQAQQAWEANNKALIEIILSSRHQGLALNAVQLEVLRIMAAECIFEGGRPVSIARSVIEAHDGTIIENTCDAGGTQERVGAAQLTAEKLRLSPNPARSEVRIDFADFGVVSLHIYRLDGGVQYAQETLDNQTIHQISTTSWKAGTYFVKAQDATGAIRTSLLSVVK